MRGRLSCLGTGLLLLGSLGLLGCFESHRLPRRFVRDGAIVDAEPAVPSCFDRVVDTIVVGDEPGCVDAMIRGQGTFTSIPASGSPVRIVDASAGLEIEIFVAPRCDASPSDIDIGVTWFDELCERGESVSGTCPGFAAHRVSFGDISSDSVLEARIAGEGAVVLLTVCGVRR